MSARERINEAVERLLPRDPYALVGGAKRGASHTFRRRGMSDPLWGLIELLPHEAALMVTPLMRRLHNIRQTAFAYFAHPGATHDRFSHSLGVMHQASEMMRNLSRYHPDLAQENSRNLCLLRLAALLHDVGHGPYSHSSEGYFRDRLDMRRLQQEMAVELEIPVAKLGAAETISAAIVTSPTFRKFFEACASESEYPLDQISCEEIARFFFGCHSGDTPPWLPKIISGSIDADKLDYLHRDGEFAGLETAVDLTRLYSNLRLSDNRLVVLRDGLTSIGDLAENRFSLTMLMYSEPLSRAAESMFRRALEVDARNDETKLDSCASFFEFDDSSIIPYLKSAKNPLVKDLAWRVQFGNLYGVSFSISVPLLKQRAIKLGAVADDEQCEHIIESLRDRRKQVELEAQFALRALDLRLERSKTPETAYQVEAFDGQKIPFTPDMVMIDVTKPLNFQDLGHELVVVHGQEYNEEFVVEADTLLSLEERRVSYRRNLWRGYVITHPEFRSYVREAVIEYFDDLLSRST